MFELLKNKRILVLAAHPDDETLGCGGAIKKLSDEGHDIQLLTFTDGVGSRRAGEENRNPKLKLVSDILGISKYSSGNFPDNAMDSIPLLEVCKFIESNVDYDPDIIFTHFIGDLNIDHQIVTKAALSAFRPQRGNKMKIYSYYVHSSTDYNPTTYFDGRVYLELHASHMQAKMDALKIYEVEMRPYPHSRSYQNVENLMRVWGSEVGLVYCEKFKLLREII
jgi:LmbE family N-acetylglucosaminyl deacetylase